MSLWQEDLYLPCSPPLRRGGGARDVSPGVESLAHLLPVGRSGVNSTLAVGVTPRHIETRLLKYPGAPRTSARYGGYSRGCIPRGLASFRNDVEEALTLLVNSLQGSSSLGFFTAKYYRRHFRSKKWFRKYSNRDAHVRDQTTAPEGLRHPEADAARSDGHVLASWPILAASPRPMVMPGGAP